MGSRLVGRESLVEDLSGALRNGASILLVGPAGVGKSAVLAAVLEQRDLRSCAIERIVGTVGGRDIALGALFSFVDADAPEQEAQLLAAVRTRLLERAHNRPLVLAVDDAHLLDSSSLTVVAGLVVNDGAVLAMTARSGDPWPPALLDLRAKNLVGTVEVPPLPIDATRDLAAHILGGEIPERHTTMLHEATGGVPLLLRELLADAIAGGGIVQQDGMWQLVGPLRAGRRVQEVVRARVGRLPDDELRLLELISIGEVVAVDLLGVDEHPRLDQLEERSLVTLHPGPSGTLDARPAHPLIGEAVRESVPTRRRRELSRDLGERLVSAVDVGRGRPLHACRLLLDADAAVPAALALTAAREALQVFDLELAESVALPVAESAGSFEAWSIVAEARRRQGHASAAMDAIARGEQAVMTDDQRVELATTHAMLLTHQLGRPDRAAHVLERAADDVADPASSEGLRQLATSMVGPLGGYPELLSSNRRMLADDGISDEERFMASQTAAFAAVVLADGSAPDLLDVAFELAPRVESAQPPEMVDYLWAMRAGLHVQHGTIDVGIEEVDAHIERCRAEGAMYIASATIHLQQLLHRGSDRLFALGEAIRDGSAGPDVFGVAPIAEATVAMAHARCGNTIAAAEALDRVPSGLTDERALPFVAAAEAVLTMDTDPHAAVAIAIEGGRRARTTTHLAFAIVTLHAVVGGPDADELADELRIASAAVDGTLLLAMADHGAAFAAADTEALDEVARRFVELGAWYPAAVAFGQAVGMHPDGSAAARRADVRARLWADAVHPFRPSWAAVEDPLSDRQLDVAVLAASGLSSRQIAERLYLSVRTVENHLRLVYRKLEIGGRAGLVEAMGPLPPRLHGTA